MRTQLLPTLLLLIFVAGCNFIDIGENVNSWKCDAVNHSQGKNINQSVKGALLATRYASLEQLKSVVQIEYVNEFGEPDSTQLTSSMVRLKQCANGQHMVSELKSGVSQDDIVAARDGSFWDRLDLIFTSPYAISNRVDMKRIYMLARRSFSLFGVGDVAFYDLAERAVEKIKKETMAYPNSRDSSEKGYINSFNHITAQAFITSFYSEEMADFVADLHELHNMPEITSGRFTEEQLVSLTNNPVDNYVDMINNEWGQEIGKQLKKKFHIDRKTHWTPNLLANYLNDLQHYYSWVFEIEMEPFRPQDNVVVRFSDKINKVMKGAAD